MALIMPIMINDTTIGALTVRRTERLDKRETYLYEYDLFFKGGETLRSPRPEEQHRGTVEHNYRDGAGVLIKKVLEAVYV